MAVLSFRTGSTARSTSVMPVVKDHRGNAPFAPQLLGWRPKSGSPGFVPNTADSDNAASVALAGAILDELEIPREVASGVRNPQSGRPLELAVTATLQQDLPQLDPRGRGSSIRPFTRLQTSCSTTISIKWTSW